MAAKLAEADQMTVEEFLAFYDSRPDGERWELIEGVAIVNAAPTEWHQRIAQNVSGVLDAWKLKTGAKWTAILGVGTRVPNSPNSLPQPDLFVKSGEAANSSVTDASLVIFEVLSKSNTKADQTWRKRVYSSVPNCQHYLTIATTSAACIRYDRADGWQGETIKGLDGVLLLPVIDVTIPLTDIYRWTPIK